MFSRIPPKIPDKSVTVKDVADADGKIVINFSKLNKRIQDCREDKLNNTCRAQLREIGVEFTDEI